MKQTKTLRRAIVPVVALFVLLLTVFGAKKVGAATTVVVPVTERLAHSELFSKDPTFSLEKSASWINIREYSPSSFRIYADYNPGKGRIGYVYLKRQGVVVTKYKVIQQGYATITVGPGKGSTSFIGKDAGQTLSVSGTTNPWFSFYCPNAYNFRIDYSANTSGHSRYRYVYVKEGSTLVTTYEILQESN